LKKIHIFVFMLHSDILKIRNKILSLKYNVSKKEIEGINNNNFNYELYELKKCLEFVLHVFDEEGRLETLKLEEIVSNVKHSKKEANNILRTLKLVKIKYELLH